MMITYIIIGSETFQQQISNDSPSLIRSFNRNLTVKLNKKILLYILNIGEKKVMQIYLLPKTSNAMIGSSLLNN